MGGERRNPGQPADATPALGSVGYPGSWQTWRLAVAPGSPARPFELRITDVEGHRWSNELEKDPAGSRHQFSAHFLPGAVA